MKLGKGECVVRMKGTDWRGGEGYCKCDVGVIRVW